MKPVYSNKYYDEYIEELKELGFIRIWGGRSPTYLFNINKETSFRTVWVTVYKTYVHGEGSIHAGIDLEAMETVRFDLDEINLNAPSGPHELGELLKIKIKEYS